MFTKKLIITMRRESEIVQKKEHINKNVPYAGMQHFENSIVHQAVVPLVGSLVEQNDGSKITQ